MKRLSYALGITLLLCCLLCTAWADGAPASQFGFTGWPYRATTQCAPATAAPATQAPATQAPATQAPPTRIPATQSPTKAPQPTKKPGVSDGTGDYTTVSVTTQEGIAWNLLNEDRAANGLAALPLDAELSRIARVKSNDMKTNNYFAHVSPTYGNAASMLTYFGYAYKGVGENIAHHATVTKAQAAFMSSSGHRANILGSQWTKVGVGVCYDEDGYVYVTQLFAR